MKDEKDITKLFHNRLSDAEMPVCEGFWEELEEELQATSTPTLFRTFRPSGAIAAAVAALLVAASVTLFRLYTPEKVLHDAVAIEESARPESLQTAQAMPTEEELMPTETVNSQDNRSTQLLHTGTPTGLQSTDEEEDMVSVELSITILQPLSRQQKRDNEAVCMAQQAAGKDGQPIQKQGNLLPEVETAEEADEGKKRGGSWSWKVGMGTGTPDAPLTASIGVEHSVNDYFALETGIEYHLLEESGRKLHSVSVPLRMNLYPMPAKRTGLYLTAGVSAEKCVAGEADNSLSAEPIQLSVAAGAGIRHKINERLALFAESTVSHHFGDDSPLQSLRAAHSLNFNLLCGLRATF